MAPGARRIEPGSTRMSGRAYNCPPPGHPVAQINDPYVDAGGLVQVIDRIGGGRYVLEPEPVLAALMDAARA